MVGIEREEEPVSLLAVCGINQGFGLSTTTPSASYSTTAWSNSSHMSIRLLLRRGTSVEPWATTHGQNQRGRNQWFKPTESLYCTLLKGFYWLAAANDRQHIRSVISNIFWVAGWTTFWGLAPDEAGWISGGRGLECKLGLKWIQEATTGLHLLYQCTISPKMK